MDYSLIIAIESGIGLLLIILFLIYRNNVQKKLGESNTLNDQIEEQNKQLAEIKSNISDFTKKLNILNQEVNSSAIERERVTEEQIRLSKQLEISKDKFEKINKETLALQKLSTNATHLKNELNSSIGKLDLIKDEIVELKHDRTKLTEEKQKLMSRVDLYSRLEEFVSVGHFEEPKYLYETSARFAEEIKRVRQKQKQLIKEKAAVAYPESLSITSDKGIDKKILTGQVNLMLSSFNIDCDNLISKVKPSTFPRTLEQIEKLAIKLEKFAVSLHCGFNTEYVKLKYEECKFQYQYTLKKQAEQEEQRLIKEQMREEIKAQKEYERAIAEAEKEEKMYRKMLEKAKESLQKATDEDRIIAQQRIEDLEQQLAETLAKEERVKSLAEQTRRGHVYVISNIGSFGEGICKIGLTRRLDPLVRVNELGDASVPFKFDVHAIIHADDAPALETSLHRKFNTQRVNAVNYRKEFFHAELADIKKAVDEIVGSDVDFQMTALAEEYYESRRLREEVTV